MEGLRGFRSPSFLLHFTFLRDEPAQSPRDSRTGELIVIFDFYAKLRTFAGRGNVREASEKDGRGREASRPSSPLSLFLLQDSLYRRQRLISRPNFHQHPSTHPLHPSIRRARHRSFLQIELSTEREAARTTSNELIPQPFPFGLLFSSPANKTHLPHDTTLTRYPSILLNSPSSSIQSQAHRFAEIELFLDLWEERRAHLFFLPLVLPPLSSLHFITSAPLRRLHTSI